MTIRLYQSLPLTLSDYRRQDRAPNNHCIWQQVLIALEGSQEPSDDDIVAIGALKIEYHPNFTACAWKWLDCPSRRTSPASMLLASKSNNSWDLHSSRRKALPPKTAANFTFDTSLIPTPFYNASRRCSSTRREAVGLLALDLPREDLWDAEQH
ncbi:hypothetical protein EJ07DRAFT_158884 [Lizonia empirigonia]|nr:hypothetical protein EJ07DRAFT_158884 [Lizonia empirigonia]